MAQDHATSEDWMWFGQKRGDDADLLISSSASNKIPQKLEALIFVL
jgi:hypothetical protein